MEIETYSEKETYRLGELLGQKARPGQVYSLSGDLGDRENRAYPGDGCRFGNPGACKQSDLYDSSGL